MKSHPFKQLLISNNNILSDEQKETALQLNKLSFPILFLSNVLFVLILVLTYHQYNICVIKIFKKKKGFMFQDTCLIESWFMTVKMIINQRSTPIVRFIPFSVIAVRNNCNIEIDFGYSGHSRFNRESITFSDLLVKSKRIIHNYIISSVT